MNNEVNVMIGENLSRIRAQQAVSIQELSLKADLREDRLNLIEKGEVMASAEELYSLKTALGVDVKAFYEG